MQWVSLVTSILIFYHNLWISIVGCAWISLLNSRYNTILCGKRKRSMRERSMDCEHSEGSRSKSSRILAFHKMSLTEDFNHLDGKWWVVEKTLITLYLFWMGWVMLMSSYWSDPMDNSGHVIQHMAGIISFNPKAFPWKRVCKLIGSA
jgi:hypothetical protein